jgi:Tfp pilus assembly protein FimT
MRAGYSVAEVLVVMIVFAALAAIAVPRFHMAADRMAARAAIQEAGSLFSLARRSAIARRSPVAVLIDTANGEIIVQTGLRRVAQESLRGRYGVRLSSTRDSMSYDPRGLGYGAANLTIVARRRGAAETLFVSRLGRTRR